MTCVCMDVELSRVRMSAIPLVGLARCDSPPMSVGVAFRLSCTISFSSFLSCMQGAPRAIFQYLPLTDRLVTLFESKHMSERLQYRQRRTEEEDVYHDVFDGDCTKSLIQRQVVWEDKVYPNRYFAASTDVALQLGLDGVQCFVCNGIDCWPIIITLFSLSPELRHRQEYQICCGIIAGKVSTS